ncbi:hypothetical protein [Anaerosinus sp.]
MAYYFFIGDMMLPVPPAKMNVKVNNKNKTINLINEGEVNIIKAQGLTEISFDARLPNQNYPFADYDTSFSSSLTSQLTGSNFSFKKADYFLDNFKTSKLSNLPVRLIITRMRNWQLLFDTNMLVTLEDYNIDEDADNGFDLIVPLRFKQYRPYGTKECEVTTDENGVQHISVKETRPAYDKTVPNAYKIRNEQSMWEVCKRMSGGSLDWREVMEKNSITNPLGQVKGKVITF